MVDAATRTLLPILFLAVTQLLLVALDAKPAAHAVHHLGACKWPPRRVSRRRAQGIPRKKTTPPSLQQCLSGEDYFKQKTVACDDKAKNGCLETSAALARRSPFQSPFTALCFFFAFPSSVLPAQSFPGVSPTPNSPRRWTASRSFWPRSVAVLAPRRSCTAGLLPEDVLPGERARASAADDMTGGCPACFALPSCLLLEKKKQFKSRPLSVSRPGSASGEAVLRQR